MGDGGDGPGADALDFRLLGGLQVLRGDQPLELTAPKLRLALSVLLLERDRVVPANRLVDLLWRDDDTVGVNALQVYVSRLRATLEPDRPPRAASTVVVSQPPGYRLAVRRDALDTNRFEDAVVSGRAAARAGDVDSAARRLDDALASWVGPLLPEFGDQPFARTDTERLNELWLSAVETAGEIRLELGDQSAAYALLAPVAAGHPLREHVHSLVALAEYRMGRQADALRTIDRCRRSLIDTAGLELGRQLRQLELDILAQAPSLQGARPVAAVAPPPTVQASRDPSIIGRRRELELIESALAAATGGRGGVVVILGEAGAGKSRLAQVALGLARDRGADTGWARCPESRSAPVFWPFTQLADQLPERSAFRPSSEVDVESFGHHRALLDALDGDGLTVAVIDDLQWADVDSLRLLAQVAGDLSTKSTLLVVTVRRTAGGADETSNREALVDCMAEFARCPGALDISLGGWSVGDVAEYLVSASTDRRAAPGVGAGVPEAIHARTGGNPLFVKELTELLSSEGALDDAGSVAESRSIPASVQFVVRRRASRLPARTQQLLLVAAVIGRVFDLDTLRVASGLDADTVTEHVATALESGLVIEAGGEFSFSHALVADALAGEVNALQRAAIHASVARALTTRSEAGFGANTAAIAHHAREGVLAGTAELAIEAGGRAAELAAKQFAFEDAAAHWAGVADVLRRSRPSDAAALVGALTEQARALVDADQVLQAKAPIMAAVLAAEQAGLTTAMADALALVNNVHVWANEPYGVIDTALVDALRRTIDLLGDRDPQRRSVLLGALAAELLFADRRQYEAACEAAVAAARATGDPALVARVLGNVASIRRADTHARRQAEAKEIVALCEQHDLGPNLSLVGHFQLANTHAEVGDLESAARELAVARGWVRWLPVTRLHSQLMWFEAQLAALAGRYADASRGIAAADDLHRRGRVYDADTFSLVGWMAVAFDRGGLDEVLPTFVAGRSGYARVNAESMAAGALEVGDAGAARMLVAGYGPSASFPDDFITLFCATSALHVRSELGDLAGAAAAEAVLAPFAKHWAGAGNSPMNMGPVALALARHAALIGDHSRAQTMFELAVGGSERAGAPAWLARSLTHHAAYLRDRGAAAAAEEAVGRAGVLADHYGLVYVRRRLEVLGSA